MNTLPVMKVEVLPFQARLAQKLKAYEDGQREALRLRVGQVYKGAGTIARELYPESVEAQLEFINGFLDVTDKVMIRLNLHKEIMWMHRRNTVAIREV